MYSSSPQIIKHYVPMNFSKMSVDFKSSPKKILTSIKPIEESPLTNYKLKQLQDKPKDYVLIFKNKSVKEFMPRKKLTISPKVQKMRRKNVQPYDEQQDNVINIQNYQSQHEQLIRTHYSSSSKLDIMKLRRTGFDNFAGEQIHPKRQNKTSSTVRRNMSKAYNNSRQSSRQLKSSIRNRKTSIDKFQLLFRQIQQKSSQNEGFESLKISGSKAPNSQIVDHFKRYSLQNNNIFLLKKLVR